MKSRLNLAIAIFILSIYVLGCSNSSTEPVKSGDNKSTNTASTPEKQTSAPKDLTGTYTVTGSNPNGSPYKGELKVIKQGEVYQFQWDTGQTYDGVGVENGGTIAVAFANGTDGKGCSVVNYKIASDGALDGKWGEWGVNNSGTEKGAMTGGTSLSGDYDVTGKRLDGKDYKGKLKVSSEGAGYKFVWDSGGTTTGFGIKQGDTVSVGIGGKQCGFVAYTVGSDGSLDGKWGAPGTTTVGTEKAVKK